MLELYEGEGSRSNSIGNAQLKTSMIAGLGGGSVEVQLNGVAAALFDKGPPETWTTGSPTTRPA